MDEIARDLLHAIRSSRHRLEVGRSANPTVILPSRLHATGNRKNKQTFNLRRVQLWRHSSQEGPYPSPLITNNVTFADVQKAMLLNTQPTETMVHPASTGCIFIGTPHRGSAFANAGTITALLGYWSGSSPLHLKNLMEGSEPLLALQTEFRRAFQAHGKRIINCRETGHEYWLGIPLPQVSRD